MTYEEECKKERKSALLTPKELLEIKMVAAGRLQKEEEEAEANGLVSQADERRGLVAQAAPFLDNQADTQ